MVINGKSTDRKKSERLDAIAREVPSNLPVQQRKAVFKSDTDAKIQGGFLIFNGNPVSLEYIEDVLFDARHDNGVSPRYMEHITLQAFRKGGQPAIPVYVGEDIRAAVGIDDRKVFVYNPENNKIETYLVKTVNLHQTSKKKK
jgi:hypothetical protein